VHHWSAAVVEAGPLKDPVAYSLLWAVGSVADERGHDTVEDLAHELMQESVAMHLQCMLAG
jgi:hypothetical protein